MPDNPTYHAIILFDGVCNLCNGFVQFIIRHDKLQYFKFAPLQSDTAKSLLLHMEINPETLPDSVILVENEALFVKSNSALRITKKLDGPIKYLNYFKFLPLWLRDPVYDFIARNRYAWFGRRVSCMVPTPEIKHRFL